MSGRAPKDKGNRFERELVKKAQEAGLEAERAWGSNGKALGCSEGVDVVIQGCRTQAKVRKTLPAYLQVPEGCDAVAFKQDRGPVMVLLPYETFLTLIEDGF